MNTASRSVLSHLIVAVIGLCIGLAIASAGSTGDSVKDQYPYTLNNSSASSDAYNKYVQSALQAFLLVTKKSARAHCYHYLQGVIHSEAGKSLSILSIENINGVGFYPDEYYCSAAAVIEELKGNGEKSVSRNEYYFKLTGSGPHIKITQKEVDDQFRRYEKELVDLYN